MIYPVTLKTIALVVGSLLVLCHIWALVQAPLAQRLMTALPRNRTMGAVFLGLAVLWFVALLVVVDMGEFAKFRNPLILFTLVLGGLSFRFLDELLAVRGLGMLALLAARPLLEAAFLQEEPTRLFVVVLAYAWILAGLFWVGMPYLLRDQIAWLVKSMSRWRAAAIGGVVYGVVLVICGLAFY